VAYIESQHLVDRTEFFRWSGCAAVVLAAHGLLALAIASRTDEIDIDAGAPVVMVELAPLSVAPPAPDNDLAPGPLQTETESQERVSQETKPEQKEPEVKRDPDQTIAPNPAVVLPPPVPEPSQKPPEEVAQPEPKQDAPVPTAPPSVTAPAEHPAAPAVGRVVRPTAAAIASWQKQLMAHLERYKRFPPQARGEHGVTHVAFAIDRHGRLMNLRIIRGSGVAILDEETLAMIRRAQPLPVPPTDISDEQLSFTVPIRYGAH
jgi:protein TonB